MGRKSKYSNDVLRRMIIEVFDNDLELVTKGFLMSLFNVSDMVIVSVLNEMLEDKEIEIVKASAGIFYRRSTSWVK